MAFFKNIANAQRSHQDGAKKDRRIEAYLCQLQVLESYCKQLSPHRRKSPSSIMVALTFTYVYIRLQRLTSCSISQPTDRYIPRPQP